MLSCFSRLQLFATPWGLQPARLLCPWDSPGKNTGVGSQFFLQGIFLTQGSNPNLPHCRQILYQLRHQGSPKILEWGAHSFSSGSSRPRNRMGVACIAGRFFISWAKAKERFQEFIFTSGYCVQWSQNFYWWMCTYWGSELKLFIRSAKIFLKH